MSNFHANLIKIGLIEDHPLFIEGLRNILILNRPVHIVFVASSKKELLEQKMNAEKLTS